MSDDIYKKVSEFFSAYRLRSFDKGQVLMLSGDETDYVYLLEKGKVKVYDVTARGDEIVLNVFKPKSYFPMSLAINKISNPYIYEAETNIQIRQAPAQDVVAFVRDNPDVMFDLLARVYVGLDGMLGRMARLMEGSARNRLIYELILESRRFSSVAADGSSTLEISEKDLGARAALSRETVSREMRKLKTENLVGVANKQIVIKNLARLEDILSQAI